MFPTGIDPVKVFEELSRLSEDERDSLFSRTVEDASELWEQAQHTHSQEGLIDRFKRWRAKFVRPGGVFADADIPPGMQEIRFSVYCDTKPDVAESRPLSTLRPMIAAELEVGSTHRGRYLCGHVAIDDAFFRGLSIVLLLKDVTGHLVEVAIYGLVDLQLPDSERQRLAAAMFPVGKPVAIIEPYNKMRQDMTEGIRIDKPQEMISWTNVPTDIATWKQLGNSFFVETNSNNRGLGALACYHAAVVTIHDEAKALAVLLHNIALCCFKTGDYGAAIQLAGAAVHLDPGYTKAWYRLAATLAKNGNKILASHVASYVMNLLINITRSERAKFESLQTKLEGCEQTTLFESYAGWCFFAFHVLPTVPVTAAEELELKQTCSSRMDDTGNSWRRIGGEFFVRKDYRQAVLCYRLAIAALSCSRSLSVLFNNIAAVHLTVYREVGSSTSISSESHHEVVIPQLEAAILNSTVAGIIDPSNWKAWVRRTEGLKEIGTEPHRCVQDLTGIAECFILDDTSSKLQQEKVTKLKHKLHEKAESFRNQVDWRKKLEPVSAVATELQRERRDADEQCMSKKPNAHLPPKSPMERADFGDSTEPENIDEYISHREMFDTMMRLHVSTINSLPASQRDKIPQEIIMMVKHRPPEIHLEFAKLRGWPDGIDGTFASKVLYRSFLNACALPWSGASVMRQGRYPVNPKDLIKRWHGTSALHILQRKPELRCGNIIDGREESPCEIKYDDRIRSNFANSPSRPECYILGTTHVAVGFNDLSSLLSARVLDTRPDDPSPLRFVGFDSSAFSVAKTKVVARMLGMADVPIESVMEVWLSSTWSESTLNAFRKAVNNELVTFGSSVNTPVESYLRYWALATPISSAKAHADFFSNLERYSSTVFTEFCSFRRQIDRLALYQHATTGEMHASPLVLQLVEKDLKTSAPSATKSKRRRNRKKKTCSTRGMDDHTVVGSVRPIGSITMWSEPPGAPPLKDELAFNVVDFGKLLDEYRSQQERGRKVADISIVDLFVIHMLKNLQRLRTLLLLGKLTITVECETINLHAESLLTRIANMRPYTISWSNVLDYFLPADFHELARRCCLFGNCVHYGYSMNWSTQVYGVSILDYDAERDKEVIDQILDAALGFEKSCSLETMLEAMGYNKLLTLPYRTNFLNTTGYILAVPLHEKWVEYFTGKARLTPGPERRWLTPTNQGMQLGSVTLAIPSALDRCSTTLHMSWCYDPEMSLKGSPC